MEGARMNVLLTLAGHFFLISLISFGGASAVLPEMHRFLVESMHWLSNSQFVALYAISQASPGPNVLFVALFGWQVAGVMGALVSMLAMCGPTSLLALAVERYGRRHQDSRWHITVRRALAPPTIGLLLATAYVLARSADVNWRLVLLTLLTVAVGARTRVNLLWMIGAGALLGALGWL
ncbi:MAG: chromate transporter [Burkholderiales bacterium]|nr:chromate transporter [Burkholderiales bacterium]MDE2608008.1 chromate transporter [Burkholderiales bacterium]